MYLFGASGHAKVIIDILESQNQTLEGLFDDNPEIIKLLDYNISPIHKINSPLIVSIGDNSTRKKIVERFPVIKFGTAIHSTAIISKNIRVGDGSVVMQGAIIQSSVKVGEHCIINSGAVVDHDCVIEDFVHVSPRATLCGNVVVGIGAHVGASAVILPGIKVGEWSVIGAGSVVVHDVPDYAVVVGNPARILKRNTRL